jgi:hypothetical protein
VDHLAGSDAPHNAAEESTLPFQSRDRMEVAMQDL